MREDQAFRVNWQTAILQNLWTDNAGTYTSTHNNDSCEALEIQRG